MKTMKVTPNVFCFSSVVNAVGKDGVNLFMTLRLRLIKFALVEDQRLKGFKMGSTGPK